MNEETKELQEKIKGLEKKIKQKKWIYEVCLHDSKTKCPRGFDGIGHSCYKFVTHRNKSREEAVKYCRRKCDSHLLVINKEGERNRLHDYLINGFKQPYITEFLTSGMIKNQPISADITRAPWVWKIHTKRTKPIHTDVIPIVPKWDVSPKINNNLKNCLILKWNSSTVFLENDHCKIERPFICELRRKVHVIVNDPE
ncbi:hypothetical protein SNE40_004552 [Patella caerulea]|uniref:C-type lectin domain-containing protein n=1 Tax=Patella caerulea TaxID=87958 RepID=A0AAN8Q146_PATCE